MAYEITMPKLSDSMETGTVVEWKKQPGDEISQGEVIAEIESDKATMELEAFREGYLSDIKVPDGDEAAVGDVIGLIDDEPPKGGKAKSGGKDEKEKSADKEESEDKSSDESEQDEKKQKEEKKDQAKEEKAEEKEDASEGEDTSPEGGDMEDYPGAGEEEDGEEKEDKGEKKKQEGKEEDAGKKDTSEKEKPKPKPEKPGDKKKLVKRQEPGSGIRDVEADYGGVKASPYARHLALQRGIDLSDIDGTGPGGRVLARDVEQATKEAKPGKDVDSEQAAPSQPKKQGTIEAPEGLPEIKADDDEAEIERPSNYWLSMVSHVAASKHYIPHFYMTAAADVGKLMKAKADIPKEKHITVGHLVTKAVVDAIAEAPEVNVSFDREKLYRWKSINIGIAVETEKGLASVTIPGADDMDYLELARATDEVVERARSGKLKKQDRSRATFTVSNLGMFNIQSFTAIIDPPASCILAVARAQDAPVVRDGALTFTKMMHMTLSADHRPVDGAGAAKFMAKLVEVLEDPGQLGLE